MGGVAARRIKTRRKKIPLRGACEPRRSGWKPLESARRRDSAEEGPLWFALPSISTRGKSVWKNGSKNESVLKRMLRTSVIRLVYFQKRRCLVFMYIFHVLFTRDQWNDMLRMAKVKQRFCCSETDEGAECFGRIRAEISTARKNVENAPQRPSGTLLPLESLHPFSSHAVKPAALTTRRWCSITATLCGFVISICVFSPTRATGEKRAFHG